jgi:hypothetical protein
MEFGIGDGDADLRAARADKLKIHPRPGSKPSIVVGQMFPFPNCRLSADQEIRQYRLVPIRLWKTGEGLAGTQTIVGIQIHDFKVPQVILDCLPASPACRQFGQRDHRRGQQAVGHFQYALFTGCMVLVAHVQPCYNYRSIDQRLHGRVSFNRSLPEILPSQVPDRARICFCCAVSFFLLGTALIPSPSSLHSIFVPGVMPWRWRNSTGIEMVPFIVTVVCIARAA